MVSASAGDPDLSASPVFFRTINVDSQLGETMAEFASSLGVGTAALVYDGGTDGERIMDAAEDRLGDLGVGIATRRRFAIFAPDYSSVISTVLDSGPGAVLLYGLSRDTETFVSDFLSAAPDIPLIAGRWMTENLRAIGAPADTFTVVAPRQSPQNEMATDAIDASEDEYGTDPGPFFLNGLSAALAVLAAIDQSPQLRPSSIRSELISIEVMTPLGVIGFDEAGEMVGDDVGYDLYRPDTNGFSEVSW